jgi:hypothetical protein
MRWLYRLGIMPMRVRWGKLFLWKASCSVIGRNYFCGKLPAASLVKIIFVESFPTVALVKIIFVENVPQRHWLKFILWRASRSVIG